MHIMKLFAAICAYLLTIFTCFSISAYKGPIKVKQPDGSEITIKLNGDENRKWASTTDGYTLICNNSGFWTYATQDSSGIIIASSFVASDPQSCNVILKYADLKRQPPTNT